MKKYILLLLAVLFSANLYSAELYMILYSGKASSITASKVVEIPAYKKYRLLNTMSLEFKGDPVFIIYSTDNKYLDCLASYTGRIPCSSIISKLKPIPSAGFLKVVGSYDELRDTGEKTKATVRAGSKGLNTKKSSLKELEEYVLPADSTRVIGTTVNLQWKTKEKLLKGQLTVTNAQGSEILRQPINQEGSQSITIPASGWYNWEITSDEENKVIETNSFRKLSAEDSKKELDKLQIFKNSIRDLLKETQEYLIEGYLEQNLLEN